MRFSEWSGVIIGKIIQGGFDAGSVARAFDEALVDIESEYAQGELGSAAACFIRVFEKYDDELKMARERGEGVSSRAMGDERGITEDEADYGWRRGTKKKQALLNGFWGGEVDFSLRRRKAFYYLPLIRLARTIKFSGFTIKPFMEDSAYGSMLDDSVFDGAGSVVEVDGFESGGYLDPEVDARVFDSVERLKFGYFFFNPSHAGCVSGYVSSETFECFRIVEKNPDGHFEQKVGVSNGMFEFSESLQAYYRHRISHTQRPIELTEFKLSYVDFLTEGLVTADHMAAIRMYNRCWGTYSIHSHYDKALFAKVSSEIVVSLKGINKKACARDFSAAIIKSVTKIAESSPVVSRIALEISKRGVNLEGEIEANLNGLKSARDKISHDGVPDYSYVNVPFYLVWFPVFWLVMFCDNKLREKEGIRLALFCGLMCFKVEEWQSFRFESMHIKKSHLQIYIEHSSCIPQYLKREDAARLINYCMESITNWINPIGEPEL